MKLAQAHEQLKNAHDLVMERRDRVMGFFAYGSHRRKALTGGALAATSTAADVLISLQRSSGASAFGFADLMVVGGYGVYLFASHFKYTQAYEKLADKIRQVRSRGSASALAEIGAVELPQKKEYKK